MDASIKRAQDELFAVAFDAAQRLGPEETDDPNELAARLEELSDLAHMLAAVVRGDHPLLAKNRG